MRFQVLLKKISYNKIEEVILFLNQKSFYNNSDFSMISAMFYGDKKRFYSQLVDEAKYRVYERRTARALEEFTRNFFDKIGVEPNDQIQDYSYYLKSYEPSRVIPNCYVFTVTSQFLLDAFTQDVVDEFEGAKRYDRESASSWRPFVESNDEISTILEEVRLKSYPLLKIRYVDENVKSELTTLASELDDKLPEVFGVIDLIVARSNNPWFALATRLDTKRVGGIIAPRCSSFSQASFSLLYRKNKKELFPSILEKIDKIDQELPELCELDVSDSQVFKYKLVRAIKKKYPILNSISDLDNRPHNPSIR